MPELIVIHNLPCPGDPEGRSYKEVNLAKTHQFPVGTLVEIIPDPDDSNMDGVRLYVVQHHRDCDGTPLYALTWDREDTVLEDPRFFSPKWLHGMPEWALRPVSN